MSSLDSTAVATRGAALGARVRWLMFGASDQPLLPVATLFLLLLLAYMDIAAAGVLGPEVRDTFHFNDVGLTSIAGLAGFVAVTAALPIAYIGDRFSRVDLTVVLALILGGATLASGLSPSSLAIMFIFARMATGIGEVSNGPIHQSLLADYHPASVRPRAFGLHRAGYPLGLIFGSLIAGYVGHQYGWRVAFLVLAFPAFLLAFVAGFLRDPVRGQFEGLAQRLGDLPRFSVAFRRLWEIRTLRLVWMGALISAGSVPLTTFTSLFFHDVFGLNDQQRGIVAAINGGGFLVGLLSGGVLAQLLHRRTVGGQIFYAGAAIVGAAVALAACALTHTLAVSVAMLTLASFFNGLYYPALFQVLALVSPPRIRSTGLAGGAIFYGIGALLYSIAAGALADAHGLPAALLLIAVGIALGGVVIASAMTSAYDDAVAAARVTAATSRRDSSVSAGAGPDALLETTDIEFSYGQTQVLFGTSLALSAGECLGLLGTNGAGKSTLLRVIAGLETPNRGAVFYEGADITGQVPEELARRGLVLVPGGRAVFAGLTVRENLDLATWLYRGERGPRRQAIDDALDLFPKLRPRLQQQAAVLSGGERQMVAIAQGMICRPKLLMIDELTLGLSPLVIQELTDVIAGLKKTGLTLVLVEQSVNLASLLCERAYFMEKGRVRFTGPPSELLKRPDLVRSVFLGAKVAP